MPIAPGSPPCDGVSSQPISVTHRRSPDRRVEARSCSIADRAGKSVRSPAGRYSGRRRRRRPHHPQDRRGLFRLRAREEFPLRRVADPDTAWSRSSTYRQVEKRSASRIETGWQFLRPRHRIPRVKSLTGGWASSSKLASRHRRSRAARRNLSPAERPQPLD